MQKNLSLGLDNPVHWAALILLTLVCGLIAGSYPSFYLSSFNPVLVLKGMKGKTGSAALIRKSLVVLQFTVSITLIIATIVIYQQIQHVKDRNLGFNKDRLVQMQLNGSMRKNFAAIRQDFIQSGIVENAALADHETLTAGDNTSGINWPGKDPNSQIVISQRLVSPEYISTMGMKLTEGRDFEVTDEVRMNDEGRFADSNQVFHVIITAAMAKLLGKGSAIGKTMENKNSFADMHMVVEGVMQDYVFGNMYSSVGEPVIFYCIPAATSLLYARIRPNTPTGKALAGMEAILKKENPGYPFEYQFVDDRFRRYGFR